MLWFDERQLDFLVSAVVIKDNGYDNDEEEKKVKVGGLDREQQQVGVATAADEGVYEEDAGGDSRIDRTHD
ncbi:hypothetical protein L484_022172 [Morus notabilis]|uniref:Uncharacterized protein n=1 Tax=Morus notabilis TaxID=981085 RepID=W9RAK0_9ROSA|nr:hypothetical protein L484_022172 [Morus notabilis]